MNNNESHHQLAPNSNMFSERNSSQIGESGVHPRSNLQVGSGRVPHGKPGPSTDTQGSKRVGKRDSNKPSVGGDSHQRYSTANNTSSPAK